jgi:hypothetical protein
MSNRDIIVIGGSAGATAPLRDILTNLPADLPAAVFVVLHIPAQGAGLFSTQPAASGASGPKRHGHQERAHLYRSPGSPPAPPELRLEVEIAAGERVGSDRLMGIAERAPFTCPNCGGVLSQLKASQPLRFRCQVGHAYTADALAKEQKGRVDEALRVALRIIEERAELVHRMAEEGRQNGRVAVARMYDARAAEYREYGDMIRRVMLKSLEPPKPEKAGSCQ